jgi:hypothetical protein
MREGWGLTIFRRSIRLCPVVADCATVFEKHNPNCTNSKSVRLLCIHVPLWHSTIPHLQHTLTRTKVYNVRPTHTYFQQRQNGGSVPTKTLRESFRLSMTFTIVRLTTGNYVIAYTLHECLTLLLHDYYPYVRGIPNFIFA